MSSYQIESELIGGSISVLYGCIVVLCSVWCYVMWPSRSLMFVVNSTSVVINIHYSRLFSMDLVLWSELLNIWVLIFVLLMPVAD